MDIKKKVGKALISLIVLPDIYSSTELIISVAKQYKKICYVGFNKPCHSVIEYLQTHKIDPDKFFFIDCITKSTIQRPKKLKDCIFIPSPSDFKKIKNTIKTTLQKKKFDILVFDSLSSVLVYEKELFVSRFLHSLAAMIKGLGCRAIFLILDKDVEKDVVQNLGMLTDKTIHLKSIAPPPK